MGCLGLTLATLVAAAREYGQVSCNRALKRSVLSPRPAGALERSSFSAAHHNPAGGSW